MKRRLLILGYGRLGQAFYRKYHSRYEIRGVKRTPLPDDPCPLVLTPIVSDAIVPHLRWAEALLFCPAPGRDRGDPSAALFRYRETYLGNMTFLIERIRQEGITPRSFILIGSTGVYPRSEAGPWTEDRSISIETPRQEILLQTEQTLIQSGLPYVVLRCGGLYGEGRETFSHLRHRERFLTSEMTDDRIALVHHDDLCDLIDRVIREEVRNEIFNVVDDVGLLRGDLYRSAAERYGISIVDDGPPVAPVIDRTIPNSKVKTRLGMVFRPFEF